MKRLKHSMAVKVNKEFLNPMTNRMAEPGSVLNVPKNMFWHRRINDKCVETVAKAKAKAPSKTDSKKGSK